MACLIFPWFETEACQFQFSLCRQDRKLLLCHSSFHLPVVRKVFCLELDSTVGRILRHYKCHRVQFYNVLVELLGVIKILRHSSRKIIHRTYLCVKNYAEAWIYATNHCLTWAQYVRHWQHLFSSQPVVGTASVGLSRVRAVDVKSR